METGVRRETASGYLKAAGSAVRPPRTRRRSSPAGGHRLQSGIDAKSGQSGSGGHRFGGGQGDREAGAANVIAAGAVKVIAEPTRAPAPSACEPHRERIEHTLSLGQNATAIYQELADAGIAVGYASVKRFVRKLRGALSLDATSGWVARAGGARGCDRASRGRLLRPRPVLAPAALDGSGRDDPVACWPVDDASPPRPGICTSIAPPR